MKIKKMTIAILAVVLLAMILILSSCGGKTQREMPFEIEGTYIGFTGDEISWIFAENDPESQSGQEAVITKISDGVYKISSSLPMLNNAEIKYLTSNSLYADYTGEEKAMCFSLDGNSIMLLWRGSSNNDGGFVLIADDGTTNLTDYFVRAD